MRVLALLHELCAGEHDVAGIVFLWARLAAKGSTVDEVLVGDPDGFGRRDVEMFRAAGLSMMVTPESERRMSLACRSGRARIWSPCCSCRCSSGG